MPSGVDPHHIQPGQDPLLDHLLDRHRFPNGEPHKGNLVQVEAAHWNNEEIRKQILEGMGAKQGDGMMPDDFYELRATFHEDALNCFAQHGRPSEGCRDYNHDSKVLGRPTKEGQAWQRENYKAPRMTLCMFCPVQTWVTTQVRLKRGDYV